MAEQVVFNPVDEHHPRCNERCHGSVHYLLGDEERMGEVATAVITSKPTDEGLDVYVNGKFVQRVTEGDEDGD